MLEKGTINKEDLITALERDIIKREKEAMKFSDDGKVQYAIAMQPHNWGCIAIRIIKDF